MIQLLPALRADLETIHVEFEEVTSWADSQLLEYPDKIGLVNTVPYQDGARVRPDHG